MKSLLQLWQENGEKPFDAIHDDGRNFHCIGISPSDVALGWRKNGESDYWDANGAWWALIIPKKKLYAWLVNCDISVGGRIQFRYVEIEDFDWMGRVAYRVPQFDVEI